MAPLSEGHLALLREAVDGRRKKEDLETALGRALRRRKEGFDAYVAIMSEVRERSRRDKVTLDEAARALTAEG